MTLASDLEADLSGTFLTDFAVDVTAWGTTFKAIFDRELLEFNDNATTAPYILMRTIDLASGYTSGDLFIIEGVTYKLADVQYSEPGLTRVVLAAT
jgi:hypothetical protein